MKRPWLALLVLAMPLSACGYVNEYEKTVYDFEPSYCYRSIGGVTCYDEPFHPDGRRLVNYYGPHPSRYDAPEKEEVALPPGVAPAKSFYKDPEPDIRQIMEPQASLQDVQN